jgi:hypothetical protein
VADLDLARELARHPRFTWAPGMRSLEGDRVISGPRPPSVAPHGADREERGCGIRWSVDQHGCDGYLPCPVCEPELFREEATLPDLDDHATAGALLGMLPVGWALESPGCDGQGAYALVPDGWHETQRGSCLGEAAAKALLALWGPRG